MQTIPRVALFADCFHEVNGVALTCRELVCFAKRRRRPLLAVHSGPALAASEYGAVTRLELHRGPFSFPVDTDFSFDLFFLRHHKRVIEEMRRFGPDVIHITGPGDVGILGAIVAKQLGVPLVASWHTNVHQFGARRLERAASRLPETWRQRLGSAAEGVIFDAVARYYRLARVILAPNAELVSFIASHTGRPTRMMRRGVDTELFSPDKRRRTGGPFTLGYVGRLVPEKNVRFLAAIERTLLQQGVPDFQFVIAGHGSDVDWLKANMRQAAFRSVLEGQALARFYADMDVFVFPSYTDTYGNVIQEAMASGVPCIVTNSGGPKFLVANAENGFVCCTEDDFITAILRLMRDPELRTRMGERARMAACETSWENVFETVYEVYRDAAAGAS